MQVIHSEEHADAQLTHWLGELVSRKGSDLLLVAGAPAAIRVEGALLAIQEGTLSGDEIETMVLPALAEHARHAYQQQGIADSSYRVEGQGRFRINLHRERGRAAATVRALPSKIPALEELRLPAGVGALARLQRGLVIIGGATGSGKTTTLAALVNEINQVKKMGFFGVAVATTLIGEVVVAPFRGLATLSGKSFDPLGSGGVQEEVVGSHAGGAGNRLVLGDHVIGTGGVDGYDGCAGGAGVVGVVVVVLELVPQPTRARANRVRERVARTVDLRTAAHIHQPPRIRSPHARNLGSERRTLEAHNRRRPSDFALAAFWSQ